MPTFTVNLQGAREGRRVLYDTASQISFITEKALKRAKYSTLVDKFTIRINGFNGTDVLTTRLVGIQLKLNNEWRYFQAVVVPKIKTKLNMDLLKPVVQRFKTLKIPLSDHYLCEDSGEVDILLGADYAHIIPVQSCVLGQNTKSLCYYTCRGIMLLGDANSLLGNLNNFASLSDFMSKINKTF